MYSGNRHKAITFSFDDGVCQDRRLVPLLNRYGLKCTFNINSASLGQKGTVVFDGFTACHDKIQPEEVAKLYEGHEVAVHTLHHPDLTKLKNEDVLSEVEEDRKNLERMVGYPIVGMAYPFGTFDSRIVGILKNQTPIRYARAADKTESFDPQRSSLLTYHASARCRDFALIESLSKRFFADQSGNDLLFYIWGHAYELDYPGAWESFEKILAMLSNHPEVFYGTNREVFFPEG